MCKTAAFYAVLLSCAVLAGTSPGEAQGIDSIEPGIGSRVFQANPAMRKRIAALDHMAHVHAAVQGCPDVEIVQDNINRMFGNDGLGPVSPAELTFVGRRISDYKDQLKSQADEEICEWAYENFGPHGFREQGLVRSRQLARSGQKGARDPETTSGLSGLPTHARPPPGQKSLPAK